MNNKQITKAASLLTKQKQLQAFLRATTLWKHGMRDAADRHLMDAARMTFTEAKKSPMFRNPESALKSITDQLSKPKAPTQTKLF